MDKKSVLALILITGVIIVWMMYLSTQQRPIEPNEKFKNVLAKDTTKTDTLVNKQDTIKSKQQAPRDEINNDKYGYFSQFTTGTYKSITIENKYQKITLATKGANIKKLIIKDFKTWNGKPVNLINNKKGDLFLSFRTLQNNLIDTWDLYFNTDFDKDTIKLSEKDTVSINFNLQLSEKAAIKIHYTFYGSSYGFIYNVDMINIEEYLPNSGYRVVWGNGIKNQEQNSVDEASSSRAYASLNGDLDDLDANDEGVSESHTGLIDYAAIKNKYFAIALIPQPFKSFDGTVDIDGIQKHFPNDGLAKIYSIEFRIPYLGGITNNKFKIFAGPLDYSISKNYGVEGLVDLGFRWGIRQIGEYFMLPIFKFIHNFIPNYGVSILIFALLMKLLLYPLTLPQMRSSQKMQIVAPIINQVREKYKDDLQKQQQETMKVYSEYGINPMGGCLPILLQMPILFALYSVLRNAIELRQAEFALWITDLSVPDKIIDFGFSILGINQLSGLALLMGATLFIQQKQMITDPRQKSMIYIMPIMMTLLFNYLPSGLNLYYFTFNLVSIAMQWYMNKFSKNKLTLEDLKKIPKKEGWLQKRMREAQEIAAKQGRTIPGAPKQPIKSKNPASKKK